MPNTGGDEIDLVSAVGVDYTHLRNLLAAGKWKKADEETTRVMLKVGDREEEGYLGKDDIEDFYCKDLRTIDQLWVKYSNGRFGFSVQKRIYQSLMEIQQLSKPHPLYRKGGISVLTQTQTNEFYDLVGWLKSGDLSNYNDLRFNTEAPEGCLPVAMRFGLEYRWWGGRGAVAVGGWGDESRDVFFMECLRQLFVRLIKCNI
jgi:eukaryotic-like serine/threonine-protein kinase